MFKVKTVTAVLVSAFLLVGVVWAQDIEKHWNDFLHYTLIGRLDMAKGHAQAILDSEPDPVELLEISQGNPQGYQLLSRAKETPHDRELAELAGRLSGIIERGRFIRRTDPKLIVAEVKRLSTGDRPWYVAVQRLRNAGEYAIPYMLDALGDSGRQEEWPHIVKALPEIGRDAIRPLCVALQTTNASVKQDIINALGDIRYPQSLAYLKYVVENEQSSQLRGSAAESIGKINPSALNSPAAELFYGLAEDYYYHAESLAAAEDAAFGNIWLWDPQAGLNLVRQEVDRRYFYELMAMRVCELALKADPSFGQAIGLWLAAFFKAESANVAMPPYFGPGHADAFTYATTAGPEYLHQALARAVKDNNAYVALGAIESLAVNAGEKSLMYRVGTTQPLVEALSFGDRAVRYSAAIAIASAGPVEMFSERHLVVDNLSQALAKAPSTPDSGATTWNEQMSHGYALRSVSVMFTLALRRNPVIELLPAKDSLIAATKRDQADLQVLAGQVLAHINSPDAQRSIAAMALDEGNATNIRIKAFESLAVSAKLNASLLDEEKISAIYSLVGSAQSEATLRGAAAAAFGSLNLPSQKVKDLILDQARD
ncbi:MAG: HEAT repeat domain-containing protein [Planctomycetota bacterium]